MVLSKDMDSFGQEIQQKILEDYRAFQHYQTRVQETLAVLHDLCVKNDIPYYLAYGSLLGALRHQGQIPWDYDVDVFVPYSYRDKLLQVLDTQLPPQYHYASRLKDGKSFYNIIKLAPKEFDPEVLHVDIFWLVGAEPDGKKREKLLKQQKKYNDIKLYKYCPLRYLTEGGKVSLLYNGARKALAKLYPDWYLDGIFRKLTQYPVEGAREVMSCDWWWTYPAQWFGQPQSMTMANGQVLYLPTEPEKVLLVGYPNYMEYPSLEGRIQEFTKALRRIQRLGHRE